MNMGLIYLYSISYGVCLFTLTVGYTVGQFVIQIVKVMNIGLIKLFSIYYGICLFTVTVGHSVGHFVIQIGKVVI